MAAFDDFFAKSGENQTEEDYYFILGCAESSSFEQITKEYYIKAKQCHPDKSSDEEAHEMFKKINRAYEVLSNQETRKMYDSWKGSSLAMCFDSWVSIQTRHKPTMHFSITKGPLKVTSGGSDEKQPSEQPHYANPNTFRISSKNNTNTILEEFRTYKI